MEEAQRLLTVSVWKLYRCRGQRGGLRLHRSLQLSLLVRAARLRYLSARAAAETGSPPGAAPADPPAPHRPDAPRPPSGDPRSHRDRGETENPPSGDPRSHRDRVDTANPPSPGPANRDHPQDSSSRYRDPPSAPRLPLPGDPPNAPPASSRCPGVPPAARAGRKRRSSGSAGPAPGPVPSKRARLEAEEPALAPGPPARCWGPPAAFGLLVRAVGVC